MIKPSVITRLQEALDTVTHNDDRTVFKISAKYWEDLEPDTFNLFSSFSEVKAALLAEIIRRWG